MSSVEPADLLVRNETYRLFAALGRAPTADEVAEAAGAAAQEVAAAWRRLHDAHALVLDPATGEILMAHPFSAVPTAYRVRAEARWWYANCAWDAFGVCAALHADGTVETACPDCGEAIRIEVRDGRPDDETLLFHCLVPAARWWEDIVFT
jgi:Alkylmercury lyase